MAQFEPVSEQLRPKLSRVRLTRGHCGRKTMKLHSHWYSTSFLALTVEPQSALVGPSKPMFLTPHPELPYSSTSTSHP